MIKKYLPVIVIVLIIGAVVLYIQSMSGGSKTPEVAEITEQPTQAVSKNNGELKVKKFTVTGSSFSLDPKTMTVKKGDTVRVLFKNTEGFHDFVIDEFKIATKRIQEGQEETVEFVADKAGSFEYYCSVGSHRAQGMVG